MRVLKPRDWTRRTFGLSPKNALSLKRLAVRAMNPNNLGLSPLSLRILGWTEDKLDKKKVPSGLSRNELQSDRNIDRILWAHNH